MEHRFAAAEGDHRRAELGELVDPRHHVLGRHRLRDLVVFVAVAAVDVAAADRDDVDEQRVVGAQQTASELADRSHLAADLPVSAHQITNYIRMPRRRARSIGWRRCSRASCRTRRPTFSEPSKIAPTRRPPGSRWRAIAPARPRRCSRNCCNRGCRRTGTARSVRLKSAERQVVVWAKMHSLGARRRLLVDPDHAFGHPQLRVRRGAGGAARP